ncbi:rod shape-determining protein MreC [Bacillus mesophilus]|uniref:Cell shape-determining protein MreC n=1 Tax=Bacillus mesophilus TaxID=1808955 RepID=A0A6M0Q637_9BACI|nr:rod shape-determining protein MreC [Bacillus mesophilus]MBM7660657.1 rod shape-determining protein MreC [Bacillus mesophilus]NEY71795.1 rod shape-determining protein MreC [Bacillus mesophilus]
MPQFFLNRRLIILLVSIIILVALIGFSINDREKITLPEQFLRDSMGWVVGVFHYPANEMKGFFQNVNELRNTYKENEELKAKLEEYVELSVKANSLETENKELRDLLGKTESISDYNAIQATVIARNPDRWHEILTLNRGSNHGVEINMAVITSEGLIGKVQYVSPFTSTVQLLSAPARTNRISAIIQGKDKTLGVIEGYDDVREALLFRRIPYDADIKEGDMVISSGLGGVFPQRLVIGSVLEVFPAEDGLTKTAYVEPAANLYDINHVIVVDRTMVSEDDLVEEEEVEEN